MAEFSRMKKYENLRREINNEKQIANMKSELLEGNKGLEKREPYIPTHRKNYTTDTSVDHSESTFKNEYLDSFIQEVRQYNIQKGIRENEDTRLDILQQLSSKNREKRSNYIQEIEEVKVQEEKVETAGVPVDENSTTLEISRQVFELLNETDTNEMIHEDPKVKSDEEESLNSVIEKMQVEEDVVEETPIIDEEELSAQEEIDPITRKDLLEQTLELKAKVDSYKEELSDLNTDVSKNNKLLNMIILILIFALLGVISVVVYWLVSGGII